MEFHFNFIHYTKPTESRSTKEAEESVDEDVAVRYKKIFVVNPAGNRVASKILSPFKIIILD